MRTKLDVCGPPQTVLKTALLSSINIRDRPGSIEISLQESAEVCCCLLAFTKLAVMLAVGRPLMARVA
jgi:hypothetical protein